MGNTAGLPFLIDDDELNSTRSLDFEVQSSWNVTVRSTDGGSPALSLINTFQISIVDKLRMHWCLTALRLADNAFEVLTKAVPR